MAKNTAQTKLQKFYPWLLVIGGILGLLAAFVLTMDKFEILKDPNYEPSCNLNPIIACGSVIVTNQASAFGFPNPFIGLAAFSAVVVVGVSLLADMKITKPWYWLTFWVISFTICWFTAACFIICSLLLSSRSLSCFCKPSFNCPTLSVSVVMSCFISSALCGSSGFWLPFITSAKSTRHTAPKTIIAIIITVIV